MLKPTSPVFFMFLIFALSKPAFAQAKFLQILHTNDLHASLENAGSAGVNEPVYGGWAQVKAKLDELRASAKKNGIETLQLDAGDFSEGTLDYFPDQGSKVLKAFQHLGYDAAAIGNHDWLMGARGMDALYGKYPFPFPLLASNFKISKSLKNLSRQIVPSTQVTKDGIKIGIFGISTIESLYAWIPKVDSQKNDLKIEKFEDRVVRNTAVLDADEEEEEDSPEQNALESGAKFHLIPGIASRLIQGLRKENDLIIALTHIGYAEDRVFARNSSGIDLIIGGHSHTSLETMSLESDRDGNTVPVVQAGYNGQSIGKILLKIEAGKRPEVIFYELVPVLNEGPEDAEMKILVRDTKTALEQIYGPKLDEVIGSSEVRLVSGNEGPSSYSNFVVDAMKDVVNADVAIDVGAFHGNSPQAAGPITRRNLMMMYPRKFETEQNEGLYVYEANIPGIVLKFGLEFAMKFGTYISTSGISFDAHRLPNGEYGELKNKYAGSAAEQMVTPYYPKNIKINGEPLAPFRWYHVAAPESLIRGAFGISNLAKLFLRNAHPTPHTIWDASIKYLMKIKKIEKMKNLEPNTEGLKEDSIPYEYSEERIHVPWITSKTPSSSATVMNDFLKTSAGESKKIAP